MFTSIKHGPQFHNGCLDVTDPGLNWRMNRIKSRTQEVNGTVVAANITSPGINSSQHLIILNNLHHHSRQQTRASINQAEDIRAQIPTYHFDSPIIQSKMQQQDHHQLNGRSSYRQLLPLPVHQTHQDPQPASQEHPDPQPASQEHPDPQPASQEHPDPQPALQIHQVDQEQAPDQIKQQVYQHGQEQVSRQLHPQHQEEQHVRLSLPPSDPFQVHCQEVNAFHQHFSYYARLDPAWEPDTSDWIVEGGHQPAAVFDIHGNEVDVLQYNLYSRQTIGRALPDWTQDSNQLAAYVRRMRMAYGLARDGWHSYWFIASYELRRQLRSSVNLEYAYLPFPNTINGEEHDQYNAAYVEEYGKWILKNHISAAFRRGELRI